MYLISINKKGTAVLHPDAAKLEPTLSKLSEDELLLVVLAYDYYSPYRQLSETERTRRAQAQVFRNSKKDLFKTPKIKEAVSAYMSLQYDERREQIKTYLTKISTINEAIRISDSPASITNYVKINKDLRNAVNIIEEEMMMEEEKESLTIQGKGKLSLLERWMRNKEKYKEITTKRQEKEKEKEKLQQE